MIGSLLGRSQGVPSGHLLLSQRYPYNRQVLPSLFPITLKVDLKTFSTLALLSFFPTQPFLRQSACASSIVHRPNLGPIQLVRKILFTMHFLKVVAFAAFALADLQAPRLALTRTPTEVIAGQPVGIQYIAQNLAEVIDVICDDPLTHLLTRTSLRPLY
jgi:hypothetical protein